MLGAWVIVAPPDFAPFTDNIVTLHDVMKEAWFGSKPPDEVSFVRDVYPIFQRQAGYQWVNEMALRGHGPQKNGNFLSPKVLAKLRDKSSNNSSFRQSIFARLRNPRLKSADQANYNYMPLLSGDEGDCEESKPARWLYLLETQYAVMEQWASGTFVDDWPAPTPIPNLEDFPIAQQPDALALATLSRCVGGPFFPGIEITYIARNRKLYSEPYRFDADSLKPGDITKRMAVPWQADFFECQIHWWPTQRPDFILNEEELKATELSSPIDKEDSSLDIALLRRQNWDRGVGQRLRFTTTTGCRPMPCRAITTWLQSGPRWALSSKERPSKRRKSCT